MLVKILSIDVWDEETGEADIIISVKNLKLCCFSDDSFDIEKEYDVSLSLLASSWKISDKKEKFFIQEPDSYRTTIGGEILDIQISGSDAILTVASDGIIIPVNIINIPAEASFKKEQYIIVNGRLDIMRGVQ